MQKSYLESDNSAIISNFQGVPGPLEYFIIRNLTYKAKAFVPIMTEGRFKTILEAYSPKRENLVSVLQDIQEEEGFISPEAVSETAEYFSISEADAYSVASFYAQFKFKKPGRHTIKVCKGTACHVRGSGALLAALEERLGIKEGETTPDGLVSLERVACLGACALAPAMVVDDKVHARVTLAEIEKILKSLK